MYVVVTGPPASGKSTLASALAGELRLPLLAKDVLKSGLVEALGATSLEESRRLGGAAVRALLALAHANPGGVLDSVWVDPARAIEDLTALPGPVVEVFCSCPRDLLEERYAARDHAFERPAGELWNDDSLRPLAGPWPLLEVETSRPVDVLALAQRVDADAGLAANGRVVARPIDPVVPDIDLVVAARRGTEVARNLTKGGSVPDPFAVVVTLQGVPELVMPATWMADPPSWTMGWGDPDELGPYPWAQGAVDGAHHRAYVIVAVDAEAGVVRLVGEARDGTRYDRAEPLVRRPG
ncbi:MAG TPA: AAA family ATPase [Nocardioides sp.]|nr:AAA family ATPase [Nocardioides sp.]